MDFIFATPTPQLNFIFGIKNVEILIVNKMFKEITVVEGDVDGSNTDFLLEHEAIMVVKDGSILTEIADYIKIGTGNLTVRFNTPPFFDMDDNNNSDKLQFWNNF